MAGRANSPVDGVDLRKVPLLRQRATPGVRQAILQLATGIPANLPTTPLARAILPGAQILQSTPMDKPTIGSGGAAAIRGGEDTSDETFDMDEAF